MQPSMEDCIVPVDICKNSMMNNMMMYGGGGDRWPYFTWPNFPFTRFVYVYFVNAHCHKTNSTCTLLRMITWKEITFSHGIKGRKILKGRETVTWSAFSLWPSLLLNHDWCWWKEITFLVILSLYWMNFLHCNRLTLRVSNSVIDNEGKNQRKMCSFYWLRIYGLC